VAVVPKQKKSDKPSTDPEIAALRVRADTILKATEESVRRLMQLGAEIKRLHKRSQGR
jgi:hypothetical protein